jgi:hypothetical protein
MSVPLSSDTHCGNAYVSFIERMSRRTREINAERLAQTHRMGLRIFDACDTGHLENAEQKFRDLERL